jgi:hypothetical protein
VLAVGAAVLLGIGALDVAMRPTGTEQVRPVADTSPIPPGNPGTCSLSVANRTHTMDVDRARTLTMIAGVGTQVGAIAQQTARAFDVALTDRSKYLPDVTTALNLFAHSDTVPPTPTSVAEVAAISRPGSLSCTFTGAGGPVSTARTPDALRTGVIDAFGKLPLQTAAPVAADPHAGTALTISLAPINDIRRATGWVLANWLVARGATLRLDRVSFDDYNWQPLRGWNTMPALPTATATSTGSPLSGAGATGSDQAAAARDLDQLRVVVN